MRTWLKKFWIRLLSRKRVAVSQSPFTGREQNIVWPGRVMNVGGVLLSRFQFATVLAALSVVTSVTLAGLGESDWFSRFGAVVVAAGIYYGVNAVRKLEELAQIEAFAEVFEGAEKISEGVVALTDRKSRFTATTESQRVRAAARIVEMTSNRLRPFRRIEIMLVGFGTIQWAFGDKLVEWVFRLETAGC